MFNLRNFIIRGLLEATGKMADYQIILNAAGWHDKGVLDEGDLEALQKAIDEKNATRESEITDEGGEE